MDAIGPSAERRRGDVRPHCRRGCSFDTPICRASSTRHRTRAGERTKGLWQIRFGYHDEPGAGRDRLPRLHGNNPHNGACRLRGLGAEPHWAPGQDNNTMETHRFCRGMWTEAARLRGGRQLGGIDTIRNKCSAAASREAVVGNGMRPPQTARSAASDYLMQKLREIFLESRR